jgi:hypothetical protein
MPKRFIAPIYTMFSLGVMMQIANYAKPLHYNKPNYTLQNNTTNNTANNTVNNTKRFIFSK